MDMLRGLEGRASPLFHLLGLYSQQKKLSLQRSNNRAEILVRASDSLPIRTVSESARSVE